MRVNIISVVFFALLVLFIVSNLAFAIGISLKIVMLMIGVVALPLIVMAISNNNMGATTWSNDFGSGTEVFN
jgi:hypothetical protein